MVWMIRENHRCQRCASDGKLFRWRRNTIGLFVLYRREMSFGMSFFCIRPHRARHSIHNLQFSAMTTQGGATAQDGEIEFGSFLSLSGDELDLESISSSECDEADELLEDRADVYPGGWVGGLSGFSRTPSLVVEFGEPIPLSLIASLMTGERDSYASSAVEFPPSISPKTPGIEIAASITAEGRAHISRFIESLESQGFEVTYGDADSLYITLKEGSGYIARKSYCAWPSPPTSSNPPRSSRRMESRADRRKRQLANSVDMNSHQCVQPKQQPTRVNRSPSTQCANSAATINTEL